MEAFLGPASPTSPNPHWPAGFKGGSTTLGSCGDVLLNLGKGLNLGPQKGLKDLQITGNLSNDRGFPHSSVGKESACNVGDCSLIPGLGRSSEEGIGYPLKYSWASLVAQLVKNPPATWETWVQSPDWEDPLEKGKLPTPVFWPGEFYGLYSPWGLKESHTIE